MQVAGCVVPQACLFAEVALGIAAFVLTGDAPATPMQACLSKHARAVVKNAEKHGFPFLHPSMVAGLNALALASYRLLEVGTLRMLPSDAEAVMRRETYRAYYTRQRMDAATKELLYTKMWQSIVVHLPPNEWVVPYVQWLAAATLMEIGNSAEGSRVRLHILKQCRGGGRLTVGVRVRCVMLKDTDSGLTARWDLPTSGLLDVLNCVNLDQLLEYGTRNRAGIRVDRHRSAGDLARTFAEDIDTRMRAHAACLADGRPSNERAPVFFMLAGFFNAVRALSPAMQPAVAVELLHRTALLYMRPSCLLSLSLSRASWRARSLRLLQMSPLSEDDFAQGLGAAAGQIHSSLGVHWHVSRQRHSQEDVIVQDVSRDHQVQLSKADFEGYLAVILERFGSQLARRAREGGQARPGFKAHTVRVRPDGRHSGGWRDFSDDDSAFADAEAARESSDERFMGSDYDAEGVGEWRSEDDMTDESGELESLPADDEAGQLTDSDSDSSLGSRSDSSRTRTRAARSDGRRGPPRRTGRAIGRCRAGGRPRGSLRRDARP